MVWLAGIFVALWVSILIGAGATAKTTVLTAAALIAAACTAATFAWIISSRREARRNPPQIRFDASGLIVTHRALLKAPLHIPISDIRAVAVDSQTNSSTRFPVFDDSVWSDPRIPEGEPRGYFWADGRHAIPTPYYGLHKQAPNLLVLLEHPQPGPRVRRERLHGPLNGETLTSLSVKVADAQHAKHALAELGLRRDLVLSDLHPISSRSPTHQPRPKTPAA